MTRYLRLPVWVAMLQLCFQTANRAIEIDADSFLDHLDPQTAKALFVEKGEYTLILRELKQERFAAAEVKLRQLVADKPSDAVAQEILGLVQLVQKKYDQALPQLLKAVSLKPGAISMRLGIAHIYQATGDLANAESMLLETQKLAPKRPEPDFGIGSIREQQRRFDEAVAAYEAGVAKSPGTSGVEGKLGRLYILRGDYGKAIELLEPLAKKNSVHEILGLAYFQAGRLKEAETELRTYVEVNPDVIDGIVTLGEVLFAAGKSQAAVELFEQAASRSKDPLAWHLELGNSHLRRKANDDAISVFQKLVERFPQDSRAIARLGSAWQELGRLEKAVTAFRKMQAEFPQDPVSYIRLGILYRSQLRHSESLTQLQKADELTSGDPVSTRLLVSAYLNANDGPKAIATAERLTRKFPEVLDYQMILATTHGRLGDSANALRLYRELSKAHPKNGVVLNNFANSLAQEGQLEEAEEVARKAVEILPASGSILDTLGWILVRSGKPDAGALELQKSIALSPGDPSAHYHLGVAYEAAGDKPKAIDQFRKALKLATPFPELDDTTKRLARLSS